MNNLNICKIIVIFFTVILLFLQFSFAQTADLEKIIVVRNRYHRINIIDRDMIEKLAYGSITDLLNYSSGTDLQNRGTASVQQDISFRGSTFQQVLVMIDARRINDPQTAHFNLDLPIALEDIDYIEISPGYRRARFGPDSVAGAINFVTKRPTENKIISQFLGGNHDTIKGMLSVSKSYNNFSNRITLERMESDGFQPFTDFKTLNISNFSSFEWQDMKFDLQAGYNEKEFGAYDFYTPSRGFPSREWTKTKLLSLKAELIKDALTLKPNLFLRQHNDKFMLDVNRPNLYLNHHRSNIYSFGLDADSLSTILGNISFGTQNTLERLNSVRLGKHARWQYGIYLDNEKRVSDNIDINLGIRFDKFQEFKSEPSYHLGFDYKFSKFDLFCSLSRSVRIPSYTELYYSDSTTEGNMNLSSERAFNYEIGLNRSLKDFNLRCSVFLRDEKDGIDWVRSSANAKWKSNNIDSHIFGFEGNIKSKLNDLVDIFLNYTYMDKPKEGGLDYKYGPSNASHLINGALNISLAFGNQTFSFIYKKKPKRAGWFLLNTNFSYNLSDNYKLFLQIENILNFEYEEIQGVPSPGRLVKLGTRIEW